MTVTGRLDWNGISSQCIIFPEKQWEICLRARQNTGDRAAKSTTFCSQVYNFVWKNGRPNTLMSSTFRMYQNSWRPLCGLSHSVTGLASNRHSQINSSLTWDELHSHSCHFKGALSCYSVLLCRFFFFFFWSKMAPMRPEARWAMRRPTSPTHQLHFFYTSTSELSQSINIWNINQPCQVVLLPHGLGILGKRSSAERYVERYLT